MRLSFHPILLITLIACGSRASAATLHVPADFPTIQSCIDAAVSGQDECVVAPGTYNELINFLGKAITLRSSHGPEATTIDGTGLNGSVVQMVHSESQQTVFDGFTVTKGSGQFNKTLLLFRGGGMYIFQSSPIIRHSIFRLNQADLGGGIYVHAGKPAIQHCQFLGNHAQYGGGIYNNIDSDTAILESTFGGNVAKIYGGGIRNNQSQSRIEHCTFTMNQALVGAGLRNNYSNVDVIDCDFYDNTAHQSGGGIANGESNGSIEVASDWESALRMTFDYYTVTGGKFWSNKAYGQDSSQGGGAIYDNGRATVITGVAFDQNNSANGGALFSLTDDLILRQCSLDSNSASFHGGALYGAGEVDRCRFEANSATFGNGGAIAAQPNYAWKITNSTFIDNSAALGGATFGPGEIRQCLFLENQATVAGGAVHSPKFLSHSFLAANRATLAGGALYTGLVATRVLNSVFIGNEGNTGGAIHNGYSLSLYHCTLVKNLAHDSGGAVTNVEDAMSVHPLLVRNSIIHGNMASVNGPQLWSGKKPFDTDVSSSNIEGSGGSANWNPSLGNDGGGNLDTDPEFIRFPHEGFDGWGDDPSTPNLDEGANDDFGELRLAKGSPCINAGFAPAAGETDLDGHARVLCGRVDMGAYEFGIGDFDCDQSITLTDFAAVESCSTPLGTPYPSGCEALDFEFDADVDLVDFAAWQNLLGD